MWKQVVNRQVSSCSISLDTRSSIADIQAGIIVVSGEYHTNFN